MTVTILTGDCREFLATLPAESVQCCVTSPPYFGLRDYGHDGQIGLETTPDAYVSEMVAVFREVRRVLRADGTVWLNLGDSYAGGGLGGGTEKGSLAGSSNRDRQGTERKTIKPDGLKPKDLIGIPWRVAFALQADGWVLRQEIIWAKPNPMPESVTDRCTKSHEQVFLFAKAEWSGPEPGRFAHISDEDARWLALCIDTEGCIVIKRCKHEGRGDTFAPQVSFGSTSLALMERFVGIVGHGNLARREGKNAQMWYWQAANGIAADFLRCVYPHLIVKQRQARLGIHVDSLTYHRGGKTPERKNRTAAELAVLDSLWARNKQLNRFGSPDISDVPEPRVGRWASCARYYFDAKAIAEQALNGTDLGLLRGRQSTDDAKVAWTAPSIAKRQAAGVDSRTAGSGGRNKRSVWPIATQPFIGSHFATMPPELAETCIKAGTSERGQCPHCGAPWERMVRVTAPDGRNAVTVGGKRAAAADGRPLIGSNVIDAGARGSFNAKNGVLSKETLGWAQSCACPAHQPVPQMVLDPFGGAGTTALVADRLQRDAIIIELNPAYAAMARERINGEAGMFAPAAE